MKYINTIHYIYVMNTIEILDDVSDEELPLKNDIFKKIFMHGRHYNPIIDEGTFFPQFQKSLDIPSEIRKECNYICIMRDDGTVIQKRVKR